LPVNAYNFAVLDRDSGLFGSGSPRVPKACPYLARGGPSCERRRDFRHFSGLPAAAGLGVSPEVLRTLLGWVDEADHIASSKPPPVRLELIDDDPMIPAARRSLRYCGWVRKVS
jgi:hypothetical protein